MNTALTEALDTLTVEIRAVREQLRRERRRNILTACALGLAVIIGVVGWINQRGEQDRIRDAVAVDCPGIRDIATFDLPPTASTITRQLVRNYYDSYQGRCADIFGPLPPIDPDATKPAPPPSRTPSRTPTPTAR